MGFTVFCLSFFILYFPLVISLPLSSVTGSRRVLLPQRQPLHAARTFTGRTLDYEDDLVAIGKGGVISANKSLAVLNRSQKDYDPILLKGIRGNPGIKIRVNKKSFDYFTNIFAPIIEQEIRRARIPPTVECITKLNGCIQIYNAYISHYRCPQKITIYPSSPYHLVVSIQNMGIGIAGNVIGEFNVIIPVKVSGILHVTAQQVSATVSLGIVQSGSGPPYVQVVDCQVTVGYVDAYMEDGGIVGAIANREFRHQMNQQIRARIPSKICERIPEAINNKLNKKLQDIPQTVALLELLQLINGAFALGNGPNVCEKRKHCTVAAAVEEELLTLSNETTKILRDAPIIDDETDADLLGPRLVPLKRPRILSGSTVKNYVVLAKSRQRFVSKNEDVPIILAENSDAPFNLPPSPPHPNIAFITAPEPKLNCTELPPVSNTFCRVRKFIDKLDISKLQTSLLTTHLLQTFATSDDYIIALNGEVSEFGRGGTPFGAFFIDFPNKKVTKMIEILVSDFTMNSLFYLMHKKSFLSFWFDTDSPKIGSLLRTSCAEDDEERDSVVEENSEEIIATVKEKARSSLSSIPRSRRQAETVDAFEDLGLCFGDLFPLIRKKHPNQNVSIHIYTKRAPSLILHKHPKTSADINLALLGDIFVSGEEKVGTLLIETTINIDILIKNQRISGYSDVQDFKLTNPGETLGVPQAALDKLGDIGKQFFITALNEALEKGVKIKLPSTKDISLPFNIIDLKFDIVEHAIYFAFDFTVSPSIVSKLVGNVSNNDSCSQA
uniref:Lipid-binding serum glycoprotein C-terminal domain-containing protein n=1 Tax=Panagrolaimus superbus TaxID=310955 RepID=A0A914YP94_9BILA